MNTLTQEEEDRLQSVASELEQVGEELRNRAMRGRAVGTIADFPERIRRLLREIEAVSTKRMP